VGEWSATHSKGDCDQRGVIKVDAGETDAFEKKKRGNIAAAQSLVGEEGQHFRGTLDPKRAKNFGETLPFSAQGNSLVGGRLVKTTQKCR